MVKPRRENSLRVLFLIFRSIFFFSGIDLSFVFLFSFLLLQNCYCIKKDETTWDHLQPPETTSYFNEKSSDHILKKKQIELKGESESHMSVFLSL